MTDKILKNNVGLIGFNIDSAKLANYLASNQFNVCIFKANINLETSKFEESLEDFPLVYSLRIRRITDDLKFVCDNSDTLIITYPSNTYETLIKELEKYITKEKKIILLNEDLNDTFKNTLNSNIKVLRVSEIKDIIDYLDN